MPKLLGVVLMGVLALWAVSGWAAEMEGKIQTIDTSDRTIVLDNGTKLSVAEGVSLDTLKEGTDVKVSFEERDGKNVATSVEMK
jgi:Cu/Ag efflux protein CusF